MRPRTLFPKGPRPGWRRALTGSRGFVALGLLLSLLLCAGGMVLARLPGTGTDPAPGTGTDPAPGSAQVPGPATDQAPGGALPQETAAAPNTLPPAAEADPDRPLEVPPGASGLRAGSLPASREVPEPRTLLSLPLPSADAAEGRLVAAFPQDLVPPAPASTVLSSSVASAGNTLQAALQATGDPAAVLGFYEAHFAGLGFQPGARETAGGVTTAVFSYGTSSVTVSAGSAVPGAEPGTTGYTGHTGHTGYTVFAVLRASG